MKRMIALLLALSFVLALTACGGKNQNNNGGDEDRKNDAPVNADQAAADRVAALIDDIYVQQRTADTDAQCIAAKEAWDALTDEQKAMVEG